MTGRARTTRLGSPPVAEHAGEAFLTAAVDAAVDRTEPAAPRSVFGPIADERYRVMEAIGAGGFGDVYRAFDSARQCYVALKVLRAESDDAVDRFKREFRAMQALTHPGLVALHELALSQGRWFYTMEYITGVDFMTWVRAGQIVTEPDPDDPIVPRKRPACDLGRLCRSARQLADALDFVHAAGRLHRDIKPSNVMVADGERVVLLDFGLVTDERTTRKDAFRAYGTPRYIAPEQARGRRGTAASDWYAFGTMLYEAIAGRAPFLGTNDELMRARQRTDAPPLGLLVEELDADIDCFVAKMLARDPLQRPSGREIRTWLAERAGHGASVVEVAARPRASAGAFVGRHAELAVLEEAFAKAGPTYGRVLVRGPSGIGKSALVEHFVVTQELSRAALVVRSRCFECESVPYKAFEGLIDEVRALCAETESLSLPAGFDALARLFPALRTLDPEGGHAAIEAHDAPELRRRAMGALGELLERLAGDRSVVLAFDDLQWGDVESGYLLLELARRRSRRRGLLLLSYRSETPERAGCVEFLEGALLGEPTRVLDVEPLPPQTGRQLLRSCAGPRLDLTSPEIEALLAEADGNAFLIEELAHYLSERDGHVDPRTTLRRLLRERLGMLPPDALRLLRVVAVAGNPIDEPVATMAANASERGRHLTRSLIADRRLRRVGVEGRELLTYHDRIREEVVAVLDEGELAETHLRIARAMQALGYANPEALLEHLLAAGETNEAVRYAIASARRAAAALAYDRAAELYATALRYVDAAAPERAELLFEHARVLAYKGRGLEAAARYSEVAGLVAPERALECRRLAAEQLLRSGHLDEGLHAARDVLREVGVSLPSNSTLAVAAVLARRAWLRRRGLAHVPREAAHVPRELLERIDTAHNIAISLGLTDIVLGYGLHSQSLTAALDAGEPHRLARALAFDAAYSAASAGSRDREHVALLHRTARTVARGLDDPYVDAMLDVSASTIHWSLGRWDECVRHAHAGIERLLAQAPGAVWEIGFGRTHWLDGLAWGGRWRVMTESLDSLLADAVERGDLGQETLLRTRYYSTANLAADAPERSRAGLRAIDRWSRSGFHVEHLVVAYQSTEIALYEGDPVRAWDDLNGFWPDLKRSRLLMLQPWKVQMLTLRARAAVAAAARLQGRLRASALAQAQDDMKAVRREQTPWGDALCDLAEAARLRVVGEERAAIAALGQAVQTCEQGGMRMLAAAGRYALGIAVGGETGRDEVLRSEATMAAEGVVSPASMQRALVPFG